MGRSHWPRGFDSIVTAWAQRSCHPTWLQCFGYMAPPALFHWSARHSFRHRDRCRDHKELSRHRRYVVAHRRIVDRLNDFPEAIRTFVVSQSDCQPSFGRPLKYCDWELVSISRSTTTNLIRFIGFLPLSLFRINWLISHFF
jgi:hypothetical protein